MYSKPLGRYTHHSLILAGIGLAVLYWILEAFIESLMPGLFDNASFIDRFLAASDPNEVWMRATVVILIVGFSVYAQALIARSKRAEQEVRRLNEGLESRIAERTAQLETAVTDLKSNARMLRYSEERFRSLVQYASDVITILTPDGTIRYESPSVERVLGYRPETLVGTNAFDHVHPDDTECLLAEFKKVLANPGVSPPLEFRCRHADGSWRYLEGIGRYLLDDRAVGGMVVNSRDVTERKEAEKKLRRSLDALLTLHEAGNIMGSTLQLGEIAPRLLEIMQRTSGLDAAVVSLRDDREKMRVLHAAGPEGLRSRLHRTPEVQAARRKVLETMEPQLLRMRQPGATASPVALFLPLKARDQVIGLLEAYGREALAERETGEFLGSLAGQAASALENASLYQKLSDRERQLQDLVGRLLTAQENERHRVAYNIHDELTQVAVAAHQLLQTFAHYHPPDSPEGQRELDQALKLVQRTVRESRRVIADLRPTALDDFGLATAIRVQVDELRAEGWSIQYEETLGCRRLPVAVETSLFRITQEALTNVRKHARTVRARVELQRVDRGVRLEVRDWGCGFRASDNPKGGPGERVGLSGMRERVALLGGDFRVESEPGAGTLVIAEVPLPASEKETGRDN